MLLPCRNSAVHSPGAVPCRDFVQVIMPGDYCGEATPVPIPNTEVKLSNADGTAFAVGE